MVAMPALYAAGGNVALLYVAVFVVYWCYGTQLSVNGVAAADFWGTKNAGINYGILFTAWGVAGIIGPRIGGVLYDRYHNYQAAFLQPPRGWPQSHWSASYSPSGPVIPEQIR